MRQWALLYRDSLNPIAQLDGAGNLVSAFVYGTRPNIPDYFTQNGRVYRIVADHLGSPRLVIDAADGTVAERIDYGPWGQVTRHDITGPAGYVPIPFTFAGGIGDIDTGLVRFGARDYDPMTGRWTNKDPIRFNGGDTNLYGYVVGDPVNVIDPNGQFYFRPCVVGIGKHLKKGALSDFLQVKDIVDRIDEEESYSAACYVDPSAPRQSDGTSNDKLRALKDSLKPKPSPPDSIFEFTFGFVRACAFGYFPKYGPKYPPPPVPLPKPYQ